MAVKASNQMTLIDLTDAYSVILSNESHTFVGDVDSVASQQITYIHVSALRGSEQVSCSVGSITGLPTGLSAVSDGKTPSPTITVTATTALTAAGTFNIPITVDDITINKTFSYAIAFKGATGATGASGTSVTVKTTQVKYTSSTTTTQPADSDFTYDNPPDVAEGSYLWTRTVVTYSDNKSTTTYSYAKQGAKGDKGDKGDTGTSVTVSSTQVRYTSSATTTQPADSAFTAQTPPSVAEGSYLWTRTVVTYSDGKSTTTYSYAKQGAKGDKGDTGDAGADAITLVVTSSAGIIFKNTGIATTLTAHVYKGGLELNATQIADLGTVKWYKDGGSNAVATGNTLSITAGQVTNRASYTAQLEG